VRVGLWFDDITDGESFTQHMCLQSVDFQSSVVDMPRIGRTLLDSFELTEGVVGYPKKAIAEDPDKKVAGYYLKTHSDTAVLCVRSFATDNPKNSDFTSKFGDTVDKFLTKMKVDKKTRLIIDMRGNPGGYKLLSYDLVCLP
jgi:Peptidase family S41